MQWKLAFATFLAQHATALSFANPFEDSSFNINGDAKISDGEIKLAAHPKERGSVWTEDLVPYEEWTLEAVIRSNADTSTDIGDSGFTLWYTDKPNPIGDVHGGSDNWDGLAVMIDSMIKNQVGSVRGHLNDGTYKFLSLKDIEKESLSLCQINYRNAAGPITVRIGYSKEGFVVDVNSQKCFISTEVVLPRGYFGISANSDISGDVFSLEKMEITKGLKQDMADHLPVKKNTEKKLSGKQESEDQELEYQESEDLDNQEPQNQRQQNHQIQQQPSLHDLVSLDEVSKLITPMANRLELLDVKAVQIQSVVEQLTDTLTLSLAQVSQGKKTDGGSDDFSLLKEIRSLQAQVNELRKGSQLGTSRSSGNENRSLRETIVLALILPIPTIVAMLIYSSWKNRQRSHDKLL